MLRIQETGADPRRAAGRQMSGPSTPSEEEGEAGGSHGPLRLTLLCAPSHPCPSCSTQCSLGIATHSRLIRGQHRHKIWGQPWSLRWLLPWWLSESPVEARGPEWAATESQTSYSNSYKQIHVGKSFWQGRWWEAGGCKSWVSFPQTFPAPLRLYFFSLTLSSSVRISWVKVWEADPSPLLPGGAPWSRFGTCTLSGSVLLGTAPTPRRQSFPISQTGVILYLGGCYES